MGYNIGGRGGMGVGGRMGRVERYRVEGKLSVGMDGYEGV